MTTDCPTGPEWAAFLRNEREGPWDGVLVAHLDRCAKCREVLEALAGGADWVNRFRTDPPEPGSPISPTVRHLIASWSDRDSPSLPERTPDAAEEILPRLDAPRRSGILGTLGGYEVVRVVASGGMGTVLEAWDPRLDRVVALKLLAPALAAATTSRRRFAREARLAAAIRHERVVAIHGIEEADGLPFLVLEYVAGESLARRLDREGPLPVSALIRLAGEMAAGLAAAHAHGIIHRDVKPANVLIDAVTGGVKLTDFGLARALDDTGLTRSGFVTGTPEYLAPELVHGRPADERSDLFSLGCVLHAAATGHSPFRSESTLATLRRVCETQPPLLHEINAAVPAWLGDLVRRLLDKDPALRPATAAEVNHLLETGPTRGRVPGAGPGPPLPTRRRRWLAGAIVFVVLATLGTVRPVRFGAEPLRPGTILPSEPAAEQSPFVVFDAADRRLAGFEDLREALAAIPEGGILRLCWDGPRVLPPVVLPRHPTTIRRAARFRPLWILADPKEPAIRATAALTLAGPEFAYQPSPETQRDEDEEPSRDQPLAIPRDPGAAGPSFVHMIGAPLTLEGCLFRAELRRPTSSPGFCCLRLEDSPACTIRESMLDAPRGVGVAWRLTPDPASGADVTARLEIRRTAVLAGDAVWFAAAESRSARLVVSESSFEGRTLVLLGPDLRRAQVFLVDIESGILQTDWLLVDRRRDSSTSLPEWMQWVGQPTVCRPRLGYVPMAPPGRGARVKTARDWERFWQGSPAVSPSSWIKASRADEPVGGGQR